MSGQPVSPESAEDAAALPCMEVIRLAAKLALEHKDGLTRLLVAQMGQTGSDGGEGFRDARGPVAELGEALAEMVRDARQQHHGRLTAAGNQDKLQDRSETQRDGASHKRPRVTDKDGGTHDPELTNQTASPLPESVFALSVTAPRDAEALVVGDADLVQHVMTMLAGPKKQSRKDLGSMASVCRLWKVVSRHDDMWRGIAVELLPVVAAGATGIGCWDYMREYGRGLVERRVWGDHDWQKRLSLHVEVWDEMDGMRMFSAYGQLLCTNQGPDGACLAIGRGRRHEVAGPAFSAGSRDPVMGRLANMREHVVHCHLPEYPSRVRIRIAAVDNASGRTAIIVDTSKAQNAFSNAEVFDHDGYVPGTLIFQMDSEIILQAPNGPSVRALWTGFISPVPGQADDVTETDKLWRMGMTLDNFPASYVRFSNSVDDVKAFLFLALAQ